MMALPDMCSKRWVWEQYDHMVMGDTIQRPGADAGVVRVHGTNKGLAVTTDVTPRYVKADPYEGGKQVVAEVWRNLTAVGADPLAITDCLNFGSPENPEIMGQFVGAVEGMSEACKLLEFPVVSGNVSFYNETQSQAILPTPAVGGVGLLPDLDKHMDLGFKNDADVLILLGEEHGALGQSIYLRDILDRIQGPPPPVDLATEKATGDFVRTLIRNAQVNAVHDCSDGGLYIAIAEMAMAGNLGADITLGKSPLPAHAILFGEDQGRYIIAASATDADDILEQAQADNITARRLGHVTGSTLTIEGKNPISLTDLSRAHDDWLPNYMNKR
jgi:phosphoribosylformylglycinamidine synthase